MSYTSSPISNRSDYNNVVTVSVGGPESDYGSEKAVPIRTPSENDSLSKESSILSEDNSDEISDLGSPKFTYFVRGSDPRIATCRGKLQSKRSKLNQEINKELRLRAGAENLFKATNNRKLKETVALELSFVNSNLQLLKEQLAELNSSVEMYQSEMSESVMPMIPLGLKETKEIDLREPFKDFILEHYSEDGDLYDDAITELMDLRQAMRTPLRDLSGVSLLFQYYNQLYYVERRFFPPDRSLGIYFEWYDSLTGVPSCQRTVAFEKACVLFNMAAVYTQLGAKQDRHSSKGLDNAVDFFLRSSGTFRYICDNFTNAPSMDLNSEMLEMLSHLMLAQAKECLLEKLVLESEESKSLDLYLELAQEASHVAESYKQVGKAMVGVKDYVPLSWVSLTSVKHEYYSAMAHKQLARGLATVSDLSQLSSVAMDTLKHIHREPDIKVQLDIRVPKDEEERLLLERAHLRQTVLQLEECQRLHRMCRELRNKPGLSGVLRRAHNEAMDHFTRTEDEDDFRELLDPPQILPLTKFQLSLTPPDFSEYRVEDLFKKLGPCAVFSAKRHWTAPRLVQLQRAGRMEGFGFTVRCSCPVIVAAVEHNSLSHYGGMKEGDLIVSISDVDVKWATHETVVDLIKEAGNSLTLKLVTPMDSKTQRTIKKGSVSGSSSSSGVSNSSWNGHQSIQSTLSSNWTTEKMYSKKLTWNPFKKQSTPSLDNLLIKS